MPTSRRCRVRYNPLTIQGLDATQVYLPLYVDAGLEEIFIRLCAPEPAENKQSTGFSVARKARETWSHDFGDLTPYRGPLGGYPLK